MENPIVWALIATLGTWAVTAAGAATVFLFRRPSPEAMNRMLGFSAGVMIAASFWSLLQPAIARAAEQDGLPPWLVATLGFLLGAVFLWASDRVVTCVSCRSERGNGANRVVLLILAITLHNIPEGLAVGVAFGALQRGASPEAVMGAVSIAFGIGLQNFRRALRSLCRFGARARGGFAASCSGRPRGWLNRSRACWAHCSSAPLRRSCPMRLPLRRAR